MKTCTKCKTEKLEADFSKHPRTKDGLKSWCKYCASAATCAWAKRNRMRLAPLKALAMQRRRDRIKSSLPSYVDQMYLNMQHRVNTRATYKGLSLLPREQFVEFALRSQQLDSLYTAWVDSGFDKALSPSVDRIDVTQGYELNNLQFLSKTENLVKGTCVDRLAKKISKAFSPAVKRSLEFQREMEEAFADQLAENRGPVFEAELQEMQDFPRSYCSRWLKNNR